MAEAAEPDIEREESPVVFVRKRRRSVQLDASPSPPPGSDLVLPSASTTEDVPDEMLENDRVYWESTQKASCTDLPDDLGVAQCSRRKRSRAKDLSANDGFMEMFSLPPSAVEFSSSGSNPPVGNEDCNDSTPRAREDSALVPLDKSSGSEDPSQKEHGDMSPRKRPVSFAKPVEIRVAGSACPWEKLPTLKRAHEVSGLATDVIKSLCESGAEHLGWECRWPSAESESDPSSSSVSEPCDVSDLAQRIRKIPGAARRPLLAALPASIRGALGEHLKTSPLPSPEVTPAKEPDLNDIISGLPEVLRQVPQDVRCKVLAGVRSMGARLQAMLVAPDVATIANLLKEAAPAHRRTLTEALPQETQKALMEHMLAEKAAAMKR